VHKVPKFRWHEGCNEIENLEKAMQNITKLEGLQQHELSRIRFNFFNFGKFKPAEISLDPA